MAQGGYQAPRKPAPVSGPGSLSERTDGGPGQGAMDMPNAGYGENKDFQEIQKGAKMAEGRPMPKITPLNAPSERPDEPITEGNTMGPGGGPEQYGIRTLQQQSKEDQQSMSVYLPYLEDAANQPGVPPSFVRFVRQLRDNA